MGDVRMTKAMVYGIMFGMFATGSLNTLVLKAQDRTEYPKGHNYHHPFFQCFCMFIGEFLCMGAYYFQKWRARNKYGGKESPGFLNTSLKTDFNKALFAIPALFDVGASTLMFFALTGCAASVYQMMRGIIAVITGLMSVIFLKRKLYRHHWTGLILITLGCAIVGVVALLWDTGETGEEGDDKPKKSTEVYAVIMLLFSQLCAGVIFISEEKIVSDCYVRPIEGVGLEGMFGIAIYLVVLPIVSVIPVDDVDLAPFGTLESVPIAIFQICNNGLCLFYTLLAILSLAFFNFFGVTVTKEASATARSTIDTFRTVAIWAFSLAFGWEPFIWPQIFGFLFLTFGMLLYNEVFELPFLGFNKYTNKALAARGEGSAERRETDYAGYEAFGADSNRNVRKEIKEQERRASQPE